MKVLSSLTEVPSALARRTPPAVLALLLLPIGTDAVADESIDELKALLRAQQQSIQALESQLRQQQKSIKVLEAKVKSTEKHTPLTSPAATPPMAAAPPAVAAPAQTSPSAPAPAVRLKVPAHSVAYQEPHSPEAPEPPLPQAGMEIYGFAQADVIYDAQRMHPDWTATLRPSKIPVNCPPNGNDPGCGTNGETTVSARQSRFGVKSLIPTPLGDLKALFDFDLFGVGDTAGQTTFRLRHIWGEIGQFGAGQTESLFMDGDVFPNSIDYWGPSGMIFLRNPQVRWTPYNDDGTKLAVALESPSSAIDQGKAQEVSPDLGNSVKPRTEWPDLTAQFRAEKDWGHFQASGILRSVGYQVTAGQAGHPSKTSVGWGFNLGTGIRTVGKDLLLAQAAYGHGIASYINDGGVDLAPNQRLQGLAVPLLGWLVFYDHYWNDRWSSSLGYSETRQENTAGQTGAAFHIGRYALGNLLYHPLPNLMVGGELLWGELENKDSRSATDTRIQFSARYRFGATFDGTAFKSLF